MRGCVPMHAHQEENVLNYVDDLSGPLLLSNVSLMDGKSLSCQPKVWWGSWDATVEAERGHILGWFPWRGCRWAPGLAGRDSSAPDQWWDRAIFRVGAGGAQDENDESWGRPPSLLLLLLMVFLYYNLPDCWKLHPVIEIHLYCLITRTSSYGCLWWAEISFTGGLLKGCVCVSHAYSVHCLSFAKFPPSLIFQEKEVESKKDWVCREVDEWMDRWWPHGARN